MIDIENKPVVKLEYNREFEKTHFGMHFKKRITINVIIVLLIVGFFILDHFLTLHLSVSEWKMVGIVLMGLVLLFFFNIFYIMAVPVNYNFRKPVYVIEDKTLVYGSYAELYDGTPKTDRFLIGMEMIFERIDSVDINRSFIVVHGLIRRKVFNKRVKKIDSASVVPGSSSEYITGQWEETVDERLNVVKLPRKYSNEDELLKYLKA